MIKKFVVENDVVLLPRCSYGCVTRCCLLVMSRYEVRCCIDGQGQQGQQGQQSRKGQLSTMNQQGRYSHPEAQRKQLILFADSGRMLSMLCPLGFLTADD
jgi:hypothetical protein